MEQLGFHANKQDASHIATDGLAVRSGAYGLVGSFGNPLDARRTELGLCGFTGRQLVDRLDEIRANGWLFEAVPEPSMVAHSAPSKIITYLYEPQAQFAHAAGVRMEDPLKRSTAGLAHELGHVDGVPRYFIPIGEYGDNIMGKRLVLSEARAYLMQALVAQYLGVDRAHVQNVSAALRAGTLGGHVFDTHHYGNFDSIFRDEAVDVVNEHIENYYHKAPVTVEGRLTAFDINRGNGDGLRPLWTDEWFARAYEGAELEEVRALYRKNVLNGQSINFDTTSRLTKWGGLAGKLGLLGAGLTVTDLAGAYGRSREDGNKRLCEVGIDWAGYEVGSTWASKLTAELPLRARIPLVIACGIAGSCGARAFWEAPK